MALRSKSTQLFSKGFIREFSKAPTDLNITQIIVFSLAVHMYLLYLFQKRKLEFNNLLKIIFEIFLYIAEDLLTNPSLRTSLGEKGSWCSISGIEGDLFYYFGLLFFELSMFYKTCAKQGVKFNFDSKNLIGTLKFNNPADQVVFEELAEDFLINQFGINSSEINKKWIFGNG